MFHLLNPQEKNLCRSGPTLEFSHCFQRIGSAFGDHENVCHHPPPPPANWFRFRSPRKCLLLAPPSHRTCSAIGDRGKFVLLLPPLVAALRPGGIGWVPPPPQTKILATPVSWAGHINDDRPYPLHRCFAGEYVLANIPP